jgi:hypothetical protein
MWRQPGGCQRLLVHQPGGDLGRRAAGVGGIAGGLHHAFDMRLEPAHRRGEESRRPWDRAAPIVRIGETGDHRVERLFVAEGMDQPLLPADRQPETRNHRLEHRLIADRDRKVHARARNCADQRAGVGDARASARASSGSPRSSTPAWKNSLAPSRRWRNTLPR